MPLLLRNWPRPLSDDASPAIIEELPPTYGEIQASVEATGDILIRLVTWNQEAREPPPPEDLEKWLFQRRKYHIVSIGTQECENSFAKSILHSSKRKWETTLASALGSDYNFIRSHSLASSHIVLFAHKSIAHLVSNVRSLAVPTGIGEKLGNKGGIGIACSIAESSFVFVNSHLAAHQHATVRRTYEFRKISSILAAKIQQSEESTVIEDDVYGDDDLNEKLLDDGEIISDPTLLYPSSQLEEDLRTDSGPKTNPLVDAFDFVYWFGDMNFRINGTREVVDGMLENHMHDALLVSDQLTMLMQFNRVFSGFDEGPLNFFPTYKFDHNSDHYDSSQKRRVPSWTDRILFKSDVNTQVLSYCSVPSIRTSDHRPVYATFRSRISFDSNKEYETPSWEMRRETKSEVCCVS